jgi:hypothetical protein
MPSDTDPAMLRARARRVRLLAERFTGDQIAPRLLEFAAALEQHADALSRQHMAAAAHAMQSH